MPTTGTPIKNINVPQANTLCHPLVSTKSFRGKRPIDTTASANNATMKENAMHAILSNCLCGWLIFECHCLADEGKG